MEQVFLHLRPATCVWLEFSIVLGVAYLSVIGQSEKALFRSNEKSSNVHFFLVYIMCNCLSLFSFSHKHLKVQFLYRLIQLLFNLWLDLELPAQQFFKKMFILIRPLCSLTSKGSFPSHPQGQLSAAAILLPCFCPFIHSFLCRQRPLDCVPVSKKTFPQGTF